MTNNEKTSHRQVKMSSRIKILHLIVSFLLSSWAHYDSTYVTAFVSTSRISFSSSTSTLTTSTHDKKVKCKTDLGSSSSKIAISHDQNIQYQSNKQKKSKFSQLMSGEQISSLSTSKFQFTEPPNDNNEYFTDTQKSQSERWSITWQKQNKIQLSTTNKNIPYYSCTLPDDDIPYDIINHNNHNDIISTPIMHNKRDIYYIPSLLSNQTVSTILNLVKQYQRNNQSCQCFVAIEDGIPQYINYDSDNNNNNHNDDETTTSLLISILQPLIENELIPMAREIYNSPNIVITDALVRWYGVVDDNDDNDHHHSSSSSSSSETIVEALAPHYDVTSYASMILPLNPEECDGGLYIQYGAGSNTRHDVSTSFQNVNKSTSSATNNNNNNNNHYGEKMIRGDAILHKYDVMHGVSFKGGPRYSLVLWMAQDEQSRTSGNATWVVNESDKELSVHAAFLRGMYAKDGLYGVTQNFNDAKRYWQWASDRGHGLSQYCLAMLLIKLDFDSSNNDDVDIVKEKIVSLLTKSAEIGLDVSQHELGTIFKEGYYGVQKNKDEAMKWYRAAALQGYKRSIETLSYMNEDSINLV